MSMVTQCPHCSTAFNVTPEQLFARDGRVRCGTCRQVFDGLVQLTSLEALEAGVPPPLAKTSEAEVQARVASIADAERSAPSHGFAPLNWPMVPEVPVVPVPPTAAEITADGTASETDRVPQTLADAGSSQPDRLPLQTASLDSGEDVLVQKRPRRNPWLWAVAAGLAALVFCSQMLHSFRSEIAAYFPRVKPALVQLCAWAHCTVTPLQQPSALAIQASDLLILDKAKPHLVQLIVTMQNQSAVEVGYPAIDLVLNDRFDHAVARRVFLPADYLRGADATKTVISGSVATTVRINLDLSELSAGGFGLLLIPAPQT
ncbi:MAG TPA: DUF3426 domain-containing protein [Burkholderiales bacterium]|nr:DUF3426 domain-containing protein [Burkholderiales bacterium]